jgi:hypothetical protein
MSDDSEKRYGKAKPSPESSSPLSSSREHSPKGKKEFCLFCLYYTFIVKVKGCHIQIKLYSAIILNEILII